MQALITTPREPGSTRTATVPRSRAGDRAECFIRTLEVGVCGTDREIAAGEFGSLPPGETDLILGHELLGVVAEGGAGFAKGDLVTATVRRSCGHCAACEEGAPDACDTGDYTERGITDLHGFASELVVEDAEHVVAIPPALGRLGVLAEPASICARGIRHATRDRRPPAVGAGARAGDRRGRDRDARHLHAAARRASRSGPPPAARRRATRAGWWPRPAPATSRPRRRRWPDVREDDRRLRRRDRGGRQRRDDGRGDGARCAATASPACSASTPTPTASSSTRTLLGRDFVIENRVVFGSVNAHRTDWTAAVAALEAMQERWPDALEQLVGLRVEPDRFSEAFELPRRQGDAALRLVAGS